ncbi:MAG: ABC transporter ATP-binding protein [Sphingobacteriia bacterium]|nr:ABC transporter ATP-binding protein [Sphingobacteriia bacterium]
MIIIQQLEKKYNNRIVLSIPELKIGSGEFLGIVGNNGAGKTTLLRLMLDLIKADTGIIYSKNEPIFNSEKWKSYTGSYLDDGFLIDFLTPEEFFHFVGNTYSLNKKIVNERIKKFDSFFNGEIIGKEKKFIRDFSKGNKQKIGICSALLSNPSVLILDEPFDGLDPTSQMTLKNILTNYNKANNATIILSSHDLNYVTELSKRIVLIEKGIIIQDTINTESTLVDLQNYFNMSNELIQGNNY